MSKWLARVNEDITSHNVYMLIANETSTLTGMKAKEGKHLRCQAPVGLPTVLAAKARLKNCFINRIQSDAPDSTYFEVFPQDETTLSDLDYRVGQALNLSDPGLLSAQHVGAQYELEFALGAHVIEKLRKRFEKVGIQLGPNPELDSDVAFIVDPAENIEGDGIAENI